jgi:hypothetical protein
LAHLPDTLGVCAYTTAEAGGDHSI